MTYRQAFDGLVPIIQHLLFPPYLCHGTFLYFIPKLLMLNFDRCLILLHCTSRLSPLILFFSLNNLKFLYQKLPSYFTHILIKLYQQAAFQEGWWEQEPYPGLIHILDCLWRGLCDVVIHKGTPPYPWSYVNAYIFIHSEREIPEMAQTHFQASLKSLKSNNEHVASLPGQNIMGYPSTLHIPASLDMVIREVEGKKGKSAKPASS